MNKKTAKEGKEKAKEGLGDISIAIGSSTSNIAALQCAE